MVTLFSLKVAWSGKSLIVNIATTKHIVLGHTSTHVIDVSNILQLKQIKSVRENTNLGAKLDNTEVSGDDR